MSDPADRIAPLREFVIGMTRLVERTNDEAELIREGRELLSALIRDDAWLPEEFAQMASDSYRQYLLYCDPLERFSVVSFVWGPGHRTPVHDHTVWGLVGQLRGIERCTEYQCAAGSASPTGTEHLMRVGDIDAVSPTIGDWHVVSSAREDGPSVSIHVYGAN
ncbi:MAG: cysteine dioxygenase, partial [Quisquiliibacterium sp.]